MNQDIGAAAASGSSHYVDLPAGRFHYRRWARDIGAPTAILVHGNGGTWATWSRVAPALNAADMDVFALDLRGNGSSVKPPVGSYGLHDAAADLHDFIDALSIRAPLLIGHCWGAAIALALATGALSDRVPPSLSGLVLEELPPDMASTRSQPVVQDFLRLMRSPREYAEKWVDLVCRDWHVVDRRSLLENVYSADPDVYLSTIDDGAAAGPLLPLLGRLAEPALVLRGSPGRGGMLSDVDWQLALKHLPHGSSANDVAGCGHEIHRGDHATFMRLVTGFLHSCDGCQENTTGSAL
ncbi:alpha/beta fold hydrolase [Nonomuraea sp. bgisy094]|uniref:alpha/beta fold hydrolase n=1 Tax=Nonomuraea sp. bgisy094 TaxID=3413781 RepID=UPI003EB9B330